MVVAPMPPTVPEVVASAAARLRLGAPQRVHAVPSPMGVLLRALLTFASGVAVAAIGVWTELFIVRIGGLLMIIASIIYAVSVVRRLGQVAVLYDDGIVHTARRGVVALRWSDVARLEVITKRSAESMLGLPSHVLHTHDGTAIRISGFVTGSRELGADLHRRVPHP